MLKIWYYGGTDYMKDAPSYFDNVYEDEWIEDEFEIQIMNTGEIVHNPEEYVNGLLKAEGILDEG